MGKIQFTNINPDIEAGSGQAYYWTYNGVEYFTEIWATENSGGEEIYTVHLGRSAGNPFDSDEDRDEYEEKLQEAQDAFAKAYAEHVASAMEKAIAQALEEIGAPPVDTSGSASRQHFIDTGMYLPTEKDARNIRKFTQSENL